MDADVAQPPPTLRRRVRRADPGRLRIAVDGQAAPARARVDPDVVAGVRETADAARARSATTSRSAEPPQIVQLPAFLPR